MKSNATTTYYGATQNAIGTFQNDDAVESHGNDNLSSPTLNIIVGVEKHRVLFRETMYAAPMIITY